MPDDSASYSKFIPTQTPVVGLSLCLTTKPRASIAQRVSSMTLASPFFTSGNSYDDGIQLEVAGNGYTYMVNPS